MKKQTIILLSLFLFTMLLTSCRKDVELLLSEVTVTESDTSISGSYAGFYLLNEGNMGSNKSTLDFYDFGTGNYYRNIYAEQNPSVPKELGDVGNDLQIYGNRMYALLNASNKIEVLDAYSSKRIGQINIPNCRNITFSDGYAYATSYAGPIEIDPDYKQKGYIAKIDTAALEVTDTCVIGYQPDGIAISNGKIYAANSGGYRGAGDSKNYESTVSVVDIGTFKEIKRIEVAANLHRIEVDNNGNLWVSARSNHKDSPSRLYFIDEQKQEVTDTINLPVSNFVISGNLLYLIGMDDKKAETRFAIVNTESHKIITTNFITDGTDAELETPYGITVHPETKDIYITDAGDYINPGYLYKFNSQGKKLWSVQTGDIPAHFALLPGSLNKEGNTNGDNSAEGKHSPYITRVFEYMPAPGQFVNKLPLYEEGDTGADMAKKAEDAIKGNNGGIISLGGFGGYVIVGFDHTIENIPNKNDFVVYGNAYDNNSEPGIVMVSVDSNKNGLPDDAWYELAGSEYNNPETIHNYQITYYKPDENKPAVPHETLGYVLDAEYIKWSAGEQEEGYLYKLTFHNQSYYPMWIADTELKFSGTKLPDNVTIIEGIYHLHPYSRGYADNVANNSPKAQFDIDWAIDSNGQKVNLPGIDFIKIHTAVNQFNGPVGESSTEVSGVADLHLLNK